MYYVCRGNVKIFHMLIYFRPVKLNFSSRPTLAYLSTNIEYIKVNYILAECYMPELG